MSRQMIMSVLALYNYNDRLFNKMVYPDSFSDEQKELVRNNILSQCAELSVIYPDWDFLNLMIGVWSKIEKPTWDRIYKASLLEYNPIENYNRTELETIKDGRSEEHSGIDTNQSSGTDSRITSGNNSETHSGIDTTETDKYAYDASIPKPETVSNFQHGEAVNTNGTGSDSMTYGKTDMLTHGEKIKHRGKADKESHISGNIGVTTSQQMLEQELDIAPKLNIINIITESFKDRFCILIY